MPTDEEILADEFFLRQWEIARDLGDPPDFPADPEGVRRAAARAQERRDLAAIESARARAEAL